MEVSYDEDLVNHIGPESCVSSRKEGREALTGESAGWVLSRERGLSALSDALTMAQQLENGTAAVKAILIAARELSPGCGTSEPELRKPDPDHRSRQPQRARARAAAGDD